jgi:hypothetical protein
MRTRIVIGRRCVICEPSALVLGSRSMGLHKTVQGPRARFPVPEWGVFCHTARLRNRPARLKLVLSDSTNPSPIHRNIRVTRVNDLKRVIPLHAAVMASGSLTYLVGCGAEGRLLLYLD